MSRNENNKSLNKMFFGAPATHQNTTQEHTKPIKRQNRPHTKTIKQQNRSASHTKKTTSKPEHQVRQNSKASTPATHQNNNLKRHDRSSSHSPKLQNDTTKVPATHKIDKATKPVHQPHTNQRQPHTKSTKRQNRCTSHTPNQRCFYIFWPDTH